MGKILYRKQLRNTLRYLLMFLATFILSQYTPECRISYTTSAMMGFISAITFVIIDMYFPLVIT